MKALPLGVHITGAVVLAGLCGLFAYFPWVILESLGDFMSPPRPGIVRKQMQKFPDLKQPADYERAYPPMSREVWEAQHWLPSR